MTVVSIVVWIKRAKRGTKQLHQPYQEDVMFIINVVLDVYQRFMSVGRKSSSPEGSSSR